MLTAIIVAAGSSRRVGIDKLFAPLCGKPVLAHSVDAFEQAEDVTDIVLVARSDRHDDVTAMVKAQGWQKVRRIAIGGGHRQDSVRAGLKELGEETEYVAVHDAARPLVTPALIHRVFQQCQIDGAAVAAEPVSDTLKRADIDLFVTGAIDRTGAFAMQTPQIFERDMLESAYRAIAKDQVSVTDEVSAAEHLGYQVSLVPSEEFNLKITFPRDLHLAELILRERAGTDFLPPQA